MRFTSKIIIIVFLSLFSFFAASCTNDSDFSKDIVAEKMVEKYQKIAAEENIDILTDEGLTIFMEQYYDMFMEEYTAIFLDDLADSFISKPVISKKLMISSEDCAKQYAQLLYNEDLIDWERDLDIWVKYYEEYELWVARLKYPPTMIHGLSAIVFQAKDGKVVYYE
ncbi:MAG: hypothetical protein FWG61_05130 [Firmicutes bacterium]|nr:hypothetical protein [Bacillota bacterium]